MKKIYCVLSLMVCLLPSYSQKFELKFKSTNENITEIIFKDSSNNIRGIFNIAQNNPYNKLLNKVIDIDESGNKIYLLTKEEFFNSFNDLIIADNNDSIFYNNIIDVRLQSIARIFRTTNKYLSVVYNLIADDPDQHEIYGEKSVVFVYDSLMNVIFNSEVIPTVSEYLAVTKNGKYLVIQNGTVDEHHTIFAPGIQIRDLKVNKIVYAQEAIIYGPDYKEESEMVMYIMMLPIGYRYVFLNSESDCLLYFDLTSADERVLEITSEGLVITNSFNKTYAVKFKEMQIITL